MIAGEWSGIPWSFTAHRGDVVRNNLLPAKTAGASFVRYISRMTQSLAAGYGADASRQRAVVIHMGVDLPATPATPAPAQLAARTAVPRQPDRLEGAPVSGRSHVPVATQ